MAIKPGNGNAMADGELCQLHKQSSSPAFLFGFLQSFKVQFCQLYVLFNGTSAPPNISLRHLQARCLHVACFSGLGDVLSR